jgi:DNA replication protein DnaC
MSLLRSMSQAASTEAVCASCMSRRVVTEEGEEFARALRCPRCASVCSTCGGEGYLFEQDAEGELVSRRCGCASWDTRARLFNAATVPRRYAAVDLETGTEDVTDSVRQARIACYKMTSGFQPGDRGIGLSGPVGTGKTHLMAGVVRVLTLENAVACRFVEFTHLLSEIRLGYERGHGETEIIDGLVDVPVLVIDELGKGLSTEWQISILDALISRRYNKRVTTLVTTNFPFDVERRPPSSQSKDTFERTSLGDRIGSRMVSRLREMCAFYTLDAPDFRVRKAEEAG